MNLFARLAISLAFPLLLSTACLRPNPLDEPGDAPGENDSSTNSQSGEILTTDTSPLDASGNDSAPETDSVNAVCPGGCYIDGECYRNNEPQPGNPCRACLPDEDTTAFSSLEGTPCDDGRFCNGADTCALGECTVHAGSPCDPEGEICENETAECCALEAETLCLDDNNVWSIDSCDIPRELVADCHDENAECVDGACRCLPGWSGANCDQCTVFVNGLSNAGAGADGKSWLTAFVSLQDGIDAATSGQCRVWVTKGTYTPTLKSAGGTVRHRSFILSPGVSLIGGFAGIETSETQRSIEQNKTVLSGKTGNAQYPNVFHVITGAAGASLDGFTISDGIASQGTGDLENSGGGLLAIVADMSISSCTFTTNIAALRGSAIFARDSRLTIRDSEISNNTVIDHGIGGAVSVMTTASATPASLDIVSSTFETNYAPFGGAVHADAATVVTHNSVFQHNVASIYGGAIHGWHAEITIANALILNNYATDNGGAISAGYSIVTLNHVTAVKNQTPSKEAPHAVFLNDRSVLRVYNAILKNKQGCQEVYNTETATTDFRYSLIGGATDGTGLIYGTPLYIDEANGDYRLKCPDVALNCSPGINGASTALTPPDIFDLDADGDLEEAIPVDLYGQPRIVGTSPDLGAFEFQE